MSTVCAPEMSQAELIITEKAADDMQIPDHAIRRFARFLLPKIQLTLKVRNCLMNPLRVERKLIPGTYSHICVYKKM